MRMATQIKIENVENTCISSVCIHICFNFNFHLTTTLYNLQFTYHHSIGQKVCWCSYYCMESDQNASKCSDFGQNVGAFSMKSSSSSFLIQLNSLLTRVITRFLSTVGSNVTYNS